MFFLVFHSTLSMRYHTYLALLASVVYGSLLGKRGRESPSEYEMYVDEPMGEENLEEPLIEVPSPPRVSPSVQLTPRMSMLFLLSQYPTASASELRAAVIQAGNRIDLNTAVSLRDEIFNETRMPQWLHDLLYILPTDRPFSITALKQIAPVYAQLTSNVELLARRLNRWIKVCVEPLKQYRNIPFTDRSMSAPCIAPQITEVEWTLSESQNAKLFSEMLQEELSR